MEPTQLIEAARKGDESAIAAFLSSRLSQSPASVKVMVEGDGLKAILETAEVPNRAAILDSLRQALEDLALPAIDRVKIYAKQSGNDFPLWEEELSLPPEPESRSWLGSAIGAVGRAAAKATEVAKDAAGRAGEVIGDAAGRATDLGGPLGTAASRTGDAVAGLTGALGSTAAQAGSVARRASRGTGKLLERINNTPGLKRVAGVFRADWLVALLGQVDVVKAEAEVAQLQQKYPNETPRAIAQRVMRQKAMLAGGSGLATSFLPGVAVSLLAVDLASTTLLQAEMVYQIAGLYGMDLRDPERRTEVLTIFGLSLGGNRAVSMGLSSIFRNIPLAGAIIGAGSNAAMIYAVGYGACRFYEVQLDDSKSLPDELEAITVESEAYLETAREQELSIDRILAHLLVVGNPDASREEILQLLDIANLDVESRDAIAKHLDKPEPADLEALLDRVNPDFAVPLLAQARKIAALDGAIAPSETHLLETIEAKLQAKVPEVPSSES